MEEILNVLGGIERQGGEGDAESNAGGKLLAWNLFKLRLDERR